MPNIPATKWEEKNINNNNREVLQSEYSDVSYGRGADIRYLRNLRTVSVEK